MFGIVFWGNRFLKGQWPQQRRCEKVLLASCVLSQVSSMKSVHPADILCVGFSEERVRGRAIVKDFLALGEVCFRRSSPLPLPFSSWLNFHSVVQWFAHLFLSQIVRVASAPVPSFCGLAISLTRREPQTVIDGTRLIEVVGL
jgi:hypothetical protein